MKTVTTYEISKLFNIKHRDITRTIRGLPHNDLFTQDSYTSSQNKEIVCYVMGIDGLKLLLGRASFQRGEKMTVGIELLESFGVSVDLKLYERKNTEDDFYEMLCEFLPNKTIEREYAIGPYRVDFYIEEYHLIIEFDELFHEGQVKEDRIREASIRDIVMAEVDDIQTIIRVKAGKEITGLSRIIGYIALCSFSAIGVTSLYEDFKGTQ